MIDDSGIASIDGGHIIKGDSSPGSIAIEVGIEVVGPVQIVMGEARHIDKLVGNEIAHRFLDVGHTTHVVAVKRLQAVIGETEVEIGHSLTVETDGTDITHIVHVELGLIHLVHTRLGAVEVQAQGDSQVRVAIDTDTTRILGEHREIAAQGSEGPRHGLEARGTSEFVLGQLQDIKSVLSVYQ